MSPTSHLLSLTVVALAVLAPGVAHACRCGEYTPQGAYRRADAIVVADVIAVEGDFKAKGGGVAILRASKAWKAGVPESISVESRTTCAVDFKKGGSYLVYLKRGSDRADFSTNRCAGSRALDKAGNAIAWLRGHGAGADVGR